MELDPGKHYRMPLLLGPMFDYKNTPKWSYPEIDIVAFQYLTETDALASVLPECYQPTDEPMVTVFFSQYNGLGFMGGGGYRTATFQVAARFDGEKDHVEGDLILVMFEDKTWPILAGREDLGVPKLYADISPMKKMDDGRVCVEASLWGHLLFGLEVNSLTLRTGIVRSLAAKRINSKPWLGYKYIPSLDGPPDANYPTFTKNDTHIDRLWLGKEANVRFGTAGTEDIGYVKTLMDALAALSVVKPIQVLRFVGSASLRYDQSRRLK